ncbi:MAG TPA: SpoIIE family protein phosphatase [Thermoanaerobaculia bacterium]|nr:SpoIIE family protein phosphatase [Thermoanaerobaculia bacterium]
MTSRSRVALALLVTAVLFGGMFALMLERVHRWSAIGYAGINYVQVAGPKQPRIFGMGPGQVVMVYPGGPADRAGIHHSDEIVAIDGVRLGDVAHLREVDARAHSGSTLSYAVKRGGQLLRIPVRLDSPFKNVFLLVTMFVNAIVAFAFVSIGLVVVSRREEDRRARVFYAMATFGALSLLATTVMALDASQMRGIVADPAAILPTLAFLPVFFLGFLPLTLHLALIFPHERKILRERPSVIRWIYALPIAAVTVTTFVALLAASSMNRSTAVVKIAERSFQISTSLAAVLGLLFLLRLVYIGRREGVKTAVLNRPVQTVVAVIGTLVAIAYALAALGLKISGVIVGFSVALAPYLLVMSYPVLACIALVRSYREAGIEERRQVKWPVWGTVTALAVKIVFVVATYGAMLTIMLSGHDLGAFARWSQVCHLIPTVLYLLIPISFATAILKYRLMNIDVIIKKTVAYTILSGFIILIYLVLVGGLGTVLVNVAGVRNQTMVVASTLIVALVFVPLRNRLQYLVDRNLFRQKYDYADALKAIAAETLAATDIRAFLLFAAETLQQALQNRSVVIFERRDDELLATAKVGVSDSILGSVRFDAAAAGAIDRPVNPRKRALPESAAEALQRVEAALVVPIRSHNVLHGVIALGSKLSDREFDLDDADFLMSASDQIGLTIERIRLQREEGDFEQARQMQQALLPATLPQIEGLDVSGAWKPARAVGGDYYDLLELTPTQLAACIGDVAGKGMPAALLMSALQAAVRASAAPDVVPAELCERVRRVIVQSLAGGRFVTFFFCTIDTAARRIRYCNAGHNPPVLVRADGRTIRLDKGGPALSRLFSSTPFSGGEEPLLEGDRIVLFTDGVSEARDAGGQDYSEERLEQLIAENRKSGARELIGAISDSVSAWSGGRVDDDLTLVAVAVG